MRWPRCRGSSERQPGTRHRYASAFSLPESLANRQGERVSITVLRTHAMSGSCSLSGAAPGSLHWLHDQPGS